MIENLFIIGIGGTGAKTIEAFVYLCAAGLGPKTADIFLIDMDTHNGNLTRARDVIQRYVRIRERIRAGTDTNYFYTNINLINSEPWSPLANKNLTKNTLGSFLDLYPPNPEQDYDLLREVLFSREELEINLDTGCKAHPNIGSFLLATVFDDQKFNEVLTKTLTTDNSGIYLFNSIFGGTGAAGGPVIIKGINNKFKFDDKSGEKGFQRKPIGASVYMPYFIVPDPGDTKEMLKIKSETFDLNAATALPFYRDSVPADYIYVLGDNYKAVLKNYASGSKEQCNDAHMLELFGALYTAHFCRQNFDISKPLQTNFRMTNLGNEDPDDTGIYFEDFPKINFRNGISLVKLLFNFQIFNNFYRHFYNQLIDQKNKNRISSFIWLLELIPKNFSTQDSLLQEINDFFLGHLVWLQQMNTNNAPLKIFNSLEQIDILQYNISIEEAKNLDNLNKYLNVQEKELSDNYMTNIFNRFYSGINYFIDKNKILRGQL